MYITLHGPDYCYMQLEDCPDWLGGNAIEPINIGGGPRELRRCSSFSLSALPSLFYLYLRAKILLLSKYVNFWESKRCGFSCGILKGAMACKL